MRLTSLGALLLMALALGIIAPSGHALTTIAQSAGSGTPGEGSAGEIEPDPCIKLPKKGCVKVGPGKCAKADSGEQVTNTGNATIDVCTKKGKISSIDLHESGSASYSGNGGNFTVTGGGAANLTISGDNNTVKVTIGKTSGGGSVTVIGNGNTINNQDNGKGKTTFFSDPSDPNGANNTLNLGGETGNIVGGYWVANP